MTTPCPIQAVARRSSTSDRDVDEELFWLRSTVLVVAIRCSVPTLSQHHSRCNRPGAVMDRKTAVDRRLARADLAALFRSSADIGSAASRFSWNLGAAEWNPSCPSVDVPLEVVVGRALALGVHPLAAWRRLPTSGRVLLVAAYVGASYLIVLTALLMI